MKKILRTLLIFISVCALGSVLTNGVRAEGIVDYYDKYREYAERGGKMSVTEFLTGEVEGSDGTDDMAQGKIDRFAKDLPEDVLSALPQGGATDVAALGEGLTVGYIIDLVTSALKSASGGIVPAAGLLVTLVVISFIIKSVSGSASSSFDTAMYAAVAATAAACVLPVFRQISDHLTALTKVAEASLPVMSALLVLSGRVTSSAAGAAAVSAASAICEMIFTHAALPLIASSAAIAFAESMLPERFNMSLSSFVRKTALWISVATATVSSFIFGAQSILASASDTVGIKTVKFAIGSFVPFVGGALGDTASAVIAGASALKSAFGVLLPLAIFIMMLKPLSSLILCKIALGAAGVIASSLGTRREARLMKELGAVLSAAVAAVVSSGAIFMVISILFLICGASV